MTNRNVPSAGRRRSQLNRGSMSARPQSTLKGELALQRIINILDTKYLYVKIHNREPGWNGKTR